MVEANIIYGGTFSCYPFTFSYSRHVQAVYRTSSKHLECLPAHTLLFPPSSYRNMCRFNSGVSGTIANAPINDHDS